MVSLSVVTGLAHAPALVRSLIYKTQPLYLKPLVDLYELRYENLLTVIRITTLLLSIIVIYLAWGGKSHYHKAMAFFNPIVLLLLNFVIYVIAPDIGKYLMPIALNVGFGLFFILSLLHTSGISQSKEVQ